MLARHVDDIWFTVQVRFTEIAQSGSNASVNKIYTEINYRKKASCGSSKRYLTSCCYEALIPVIITITIITITITITIMIMIMIMKVKNDHRSKFSNWSNWKEETWKNQGFNGIRTRDLSEMIILHFDLQPQFKYMNYFIRRYNEETKFSVTPSFVLTHSSDSI